MTAGNDAYMAFGLSGSDTANQMVGADVTVAYYASIEPVAEDYYLSQQAQVSIIMFVSLPFIIIQLFPERIF